MWTDNAFPNLLVNEYAITSSPSEEYNCVAWALGDTTSWWSHLPGYHWPIAKRSPSVESLVAMFAEMGYHTCDSASLEDGFDKVAIYAKKGLWTHASRQLANGRWTSKLGPDEDIEHATPDALVGDLYGAIHCIMSKRQL